MQTKKETMDKMRETIDKVEKDKNGEIYMAYKKGEDTESLGTASNSFLFKVHDALKKKLQGELGGSDVYSALRDILKETEKDKKEE